MSEQNSPMIGALKAGDAAAWTRLLTEFRPQIENYARRMGARDAEDVAGATFEAVTRTIDGFSGSDTQFRSWVFTIAHARVVDDHRRRTRRPEVELARDVDRVVDDRLDTLLGGDERIDAALAQLTDDQRRLLRLRFVEGLSIREITTLTGRSEEAIRVAIHRSTRRLRQLVSAAEFAPA